MLTNDGEISASLLVGWINLMLTIHGVPDKNSCNLIQIYWSFIGVGRISFDQVTLVISYSLSFNIWFVRKIVLRGMTCSILVFDQMVDFASYLGRVDEDILYWSICLGHIFVLYILLVRIMGLVQAPFLLDLFKMN